LQKRQAVVKFVIAQSCRINAKGVQGCNHRVRRVVQALGFFGKEIAHRRALQEIAIVDNQRVIGLGRQLRDMARSNGKPMGLGRVVEIIMGPDLHM